MSLPRWWWALVVATLLLLVAVAVVSPAQLSVILYKAFLLASAVAISTVIDRLFFKDYRKESLNANVSRALVFVGVVLAMALGL